MVLVAKKNYYFETGSCLGNRHESKNTADKNQLGGNSWVLCFEKTVDSVSNFVYEILSII